MKLLLSICTILLLGFSTLSAQQNDDNLGTRLTQVLEQLDGYVASAPIEAKLQRVKQVQLWLDALDAYASLGSLSMHDKIEKLDDTELALLNELTTGIATLTAGKQSDPTAQTRAIVNKMPVVKNQFQVENSQPVVFYQGPNVPLEITLKGQFPLLLKDTSEVYLTNGTQKVGYTTATDTSLTFRFSHQQLGLASLSPLNVARLELHLVGQVGRKINKRRQFTSVYHIYAIALPASPGKLTVTHGGTSTNTEKQSKRTRTYLLNGSKGNLVEKQCVPSHDGWSLLPETVELVVESSAGVKNRDWNFRKTNTGGKTCFTTEVFFNSSGPSGKLEYHIKYEIKRNTVEALTETSEVDLVWGDNKLVSFEMPIVGVVFTNFLGESVPVVGSSIQSPWVQLEIQEKNIAIKTPEILTHNIIP